jgi:hypothetical protein
MWHMRYWWSSTMLWVIQKYWWVSWYVYDDYDNDDDDLLSFNKTLILQHMEHNNYNQGSTTIWSPLLILEAYPFIHSFIHPFIDTPWILSWLQNLWIWK